MKINHKIQLCLQRDHNYSFYFSLEIFLLYQKIKTLCISLFHLIMLERSQCAQFSRMSINRVFSNKQQAFLEFWVEPNSPRLGKIQCLAAAIPGENLLPWWICADFGSGSPPQKSGFVNTSEANAFFMTLTLNPEKKKIFQCSPPASKVCHFASWHIK